MLLLDELLAAPGFSPKVVTAHLDSLAPSDRVAQIRSVGKKGQARLWDAIQGYRAVGLDDLVPQGIEPLVGVTHHGKNSLLLFTHFAKVFCRPDLPDAAGTLWGYNASGATVGTWVGPGYFVVRPWEVEGELAVDYTRLPPHRPTDWPPMLPNEARLGRFVYAGMIDVLRGVSRHVSLGRAIRRGQITSNYFLLCRESSATA